MYLQENPLKRLESFALFLSFTQNTALVQIILKSSTCPCVVKAELSPYSEIYLKLSIPRF